MTQRRIMETPVRQARYVDGFRVMQGRREYVTYQDNSSIRVWYSDVPWQYESHVHSAVEILLTLDGAVDYTVLDTEYTVRKDEILIIPPEFSHSLSMGKNSSRLLFLFEPDMISSLRDVMSMPGLFRRVFYLRDGSETHTRIREMLLKISVLQKEQDVMWNTLCYSYFLRIYAALGQHYLPGTQRKRDVGHQVDQEVITSAMTYINEHFREDLTLDDVADFAGFSRYYLSRSFKKQVGYSFKDYLCRRRLQTAMDLLIRTDVPMKDVALQSGFGSVATFNRVFREHNGCTPTQYRAIYGTY